MIIGLWSIIGQGIEKINIDKPIEHLNNKVRKINNDDLDNIRTVFRIEKGLKLWQILNMIL